MAAVIGSGKGRIYQSTVETFLDPHMKAQNTQAKHGREWKLEADVCYREKMWLRNEKGKSVKQKRMDIM